MKTFAAALSAIDITTAPERAVTKPATPPSRGDEAADSGEQLTLEDAGFAPQPPVRKYAVTARADLKSVDGQTLGYTWIGVVDNWHRSAFTSFGDGHGVWEKDGGSVLPFYARNYRDVTQWAATIQPSDLMPTLKRLQEANFLAAPDGSGTARRLAVTADRVQSHGLDMAQALKPNGTGLVWAAVREGEPIARAHRSSGSDTDRTRSTVVQVTNLGISLKDSPQNTLIFVTRLDSGAPVAGAAVSLVRLDNSTYWRGTTGPDGVAMAPNTPLRKAEDPESFAFIATAEKDGDLAYVANDWSEGIAPWEFGIGVNLGEADPMLRGSVFTDRGVYRLGEEVRLKAILRQNTPNGIRLLPAGTSVLVTIRDSQNREVDERVIKMSPWSSADWSLALPADGALGTYSIRAILESDKPKVKTPEERGARPDAPDPSEDEYVRWEKSVHASFLVAAYRRPDFRVDLTLKGDSGIAGDTLDGTITARYLFGAPMGARPVAWRYSKTPGYGAPDAITNTFTDDRWLFVGWREGTSPESGDVKSQETKLTAGGSLALKLETTRDAGVPYVYTLEGDVEDVSRQHIANRTSMTVHPAPWYIGVRKPGYFLEQKNGLKTEVIAVGLDGSAVAGVPVQVTLTQVQWTSVRRAEGNGFYTWDTERKEVPAGSWTVTTATDPVPLDIPFASGGYFVLQAVGTTGDGRKAITSTSFYVLGDGYTAWARYDHNRIDLVPERKSYKPGDTARVMIQSPWEQATAILTTEREGIRTYKQFALTSTQQSVEVPITEIDIPNLYVSVLLVKGRSKSAPDATVAASDSDDASDPGKPAFRLGYVELQVEDRSKRLTVAVTADKEEYRPARSASVKLNVKDQQGRGTASEVTLWAVDYGVLSLTAFRTPDVLGSVYVHKSLQVLNADSR
ncbi:MAG TPA: MG2 domain-containing protein, partial [Vicinamibacterales bacterium]